MSDNESGLSALFVVVQALLATMIFTSLVSIMHAFMGGRREAGEFLQLEAYQAFGIGLSIAVLLYSLVWFARDGRIRTGARRAWQHMPGWMIFVAILMNLLAFVGELSYLLLGGATELLTEWINHVALACLAASSTAFLFLFALSHAHDGGQPFTKNRW